MNQNDEQLLQKQKLCFENIRTICVNYSKDSASRKTPEYLKKRLDALELHWQEFQRNHAELQTLDDQENEYFVDDVFVKTKALYEETKHKMKSAQLAHIVLTPGKASSRPTSGARETEPKPGPSKSFLLDPEPEAEPNDTARYSKLLRQQLLNFGAFERTVSKIDTKSMEDKWELDDSLAMLKARWDAIDKIHWELEFSLQDEESATYNTQYNQLEKVYDSLKKDINKKLWEDVHTRKSTPKVEIPEFNGNYNKWISFRDLYMETIHSSKWLTNSQKMQHLKSKLKGEPEKLVQHLSVSADNYYSCWDILLNRYENKRLLFSTYMNTLLSLPTLQAATAANIKKMHDTILECVNGLGNLDIDITTWDPILVHLMLPKLDAATYGDYIHDLRNPRDLPELGEFTRFLETKFMAFETLKQNNQTAKQDNQTKKPQQNNNSKSNNQQGATNSNRREKSANSYFATRKNCPVCKKPHTVMKCDVFNKMDLATRNENVTKLQLCKNCLFNHNGKECKSEKTCQICSQNHHTLLHLGNEEPAPSTQRVTNNVTSDVTEVLLTTVQLQVKNAEGNYVTLRALLDQGSQVSLITENAAQRLRLKRQKLSAVISGVGTSLGNSKGLVTLECKSIHSNFTFTSDALVMNKLISNLPSTTLSTGKWEHLQNLKLADPNFHVSSPVDLLLGADIYSLIIQDGVVKQDHKSPVAQHTKLGWILCGNVNKTFNCFVTLNEIDEISKFWEAEEINNENGALDPNEFCEKYYSETTSRLPTGQYVVKMPMKPELEEKLGKSKPQAISQFYQLERKMQRQNHFATQYKQFINEYLALGHMTPAAWSTTAQLQAFLPHHGVVREESTTTKLRVVFNASQKTDTKFSLNDLMDKGPNLQKDILTLIIKWRSYKFALTADIEKMFRAIFLHEDQRSLQRIIWRSSPQERLQEMELCTVTYGTKAAPFLAMRTLQQLAADEGKAFPLAEKALRNQFYMDDVITGHSTIEGARALQKQLYDLLLKGGFYLRKWATNEPSILQDIPEKEKSKQNVFNFKQDSPTKTLGIGWNTSTDQFCFTWELPERKDKITKRMLLSDISKLYDPLGWLAPIVVNMKLLFQNLWNSDVGWDEEIPENIAKEWKKIYSDCKVMKTIKIPRWICNDNRRIELHGFCDASEKAFACVIYTKTINAQGDYVITLLTAKTKVAPLKKKPTLPRLELCGAVLLARLIEKVKAALNENELIVRCYTDSQVTLAWIQGKNKKWEKYISNRTTIIESIVPATQWAYVKSKENPADSASRGALPSQLTNCYLWWNGPQLLKTATNETNCEKFTTKDGAIHECCITQRANDYEIINQLLDRCGTMTHATRCLAWVLRFILRLRNKNAFTTATYLTTGEINNATELFIKSTQQEYFHEDIESLRKNKVLNSKSNLLNLTPYLDDKGILRVGGRLRHSALPEKAKHPAIIPHKGRLTELVVDQAHKHTLHAGVRLTLAQIRQRYWILGGNRTVKGLLRLCVTCHRYRTNRNEQIMGNLPPERVTPSRPFTHCGVDFTGHVEVKLNKGKGVKTCKGYIAIFICLVTKAVHIELVSDLSTQTFLAALKRLCARRGTPKHMYSDNGTNFRGAAKVLYDEFREYKTMTSPEFFKDITDHQIEWHFLCPHWPSAAGVWEAAVKSMKFHLARVLGEQKLNFEQFSTLIAQIEACMNSRPLCPLTENVDELDVLTPGHFLTGTPMMSLPQDTCNEGTIDLRNKWKLVEAMHQHFWRRWSNEYLHQLQTKSKWLRPKKNIDVGDLVLVKEDNLPPGKWAMARVLDLHPGADGYVRVVTLKTKNNVLKRPITKLSPLPKREITTVPESQNESKPQERKQTRKRSGASASKLINYVTLLMFALFTLASPINANVISTTSLFKVTPIQDNRPMHFDEIGNLQLINDDWTLLVYYNLTTYWKGTSKIKKYINNLGSLCQRTDKQPCEPAIAQLKHELEQMTAYNDLLLEQHLSRKKRGYFNGVGNLARTLFRTLDEEFATKYEKDIEKINENENYLLQLIKNQTSIVETENNIIKNNEKFMEMQLDVIHDYISRANDTMSKIVYKVELMSTMNEINAASLTASLILSNLKRTQELLLDTLMNVHNGHLDVHLLTPKQLVHELHMIAARISNRLSLPVKDIEENLKDIYKLIYVKARVTKQYLLLQINIPLTSDDEYQLYRITSLPMYQPNGDILKAPPTSSHIAANFRKNTFISITQEEISECVRIKEENFICNSNLPVYSLLSTRAPCEAKILGQQTSVHCITTKAQCSDDWVRLHNINQWLYFCCENCHARIVCETQIMSINTTNIGILNLKEGCVLQKKDTSLFAHNHFGSRIELNPDLPEVPVDVNSNLNTHLQFSNNVSLPSVQLGLSSFNQSVLHDEVDKRLKLLRENEKLPATTMSSHDAHQFAVLYLLVGGACAILIYVAVRKCKREKKSTPPEGLQMHHLSAAAHRNFEDQPPPKPKRFLFSEPSGSHTSRTST